MTLLQEKPLPETTAPAYSPGTHIIASLHTGNTHLLQRYEGFQSMLKSLVVEHGLSCLGEVYHNFHPQGFTGVVCLSESHISIHTWPEHDRANMDIYLSNFERNNDGTVHAIRDAIVAFFNASITDEQTIRR